VNNMTYEIVIPVIIAFAISALLGPVVIPFLRKLKVGQTERKELESHLKKNGTPTMGGIMILASIIITSLFYVKDYPKIIPILFMTVGFGVIGFLDDYLKVVLRRSDGLLAWQKMILQIIVTGVFAVYMVKYSGVALTMLIPFSGGKYLDLDTESYGHKKDWDNSRIIFDIKQGGNDNTCQYHKSTHSRGSIFLQMGFQLFTLRLPHL